MMRSLFAAISGLRVHQTMLDVTANDIANVNTVGFKGSTVSFKDALSQLQAGASGPSTALGGTNAAADRPRRPARLDLEQDDVRRDPVDRQPVRPRGPGRRASSASPGSRRRARADLRHRRTTRAPATSPPTRPATSSRRTACTSSATPPPRRARRRPSATTDSKITIPATAKSRLDRPGRHRQLHRLRHRHVDGARRRSRSPSSRTTPGLTQAPGTKFIAVAELGRADRRRPGRHERARHARRRLARDVERRPRRTSSRT